MTTKEYESLYTREDFSPLDYPYKKIINGVVVHCTEHMSFQELSQYVDKGRKMWLSLTDVYVKPEGNDVELGYVTEEHAFERIRRITGYLTSDLKYWNSAKKAEESERVKHKVGEQ